MGFRLVYASGLSLTLLFRCVSEKSFFRSVPSLYIALYEEEEGAPTLHFKETMRLPKGAIDMDFLMEFTPKVVAMTRAVAHLSSAGQLIGS